MATVCTLPAQSSLEAALAELAAAVRALPAAHSGHTSGVVRLEVPLTRSAASVLDWLRGQQGDDMCGAAVDGQQQQQPHLAPLVYFSPRRSTAPSTPGSAAAGGGAAGAGAVAGAGAAWLWRGAPGEPLSAGVTADVQRFLSPASPRLRAFGGARFDPGAAPAPEWAEFGSYCFLIPRLELLEASGLHLLACTVAWDEGYAHSKRAAGDGNGSSAPSPAVVGFSSLKAAASDALAALAAARPPAPPAAGLFRLVRRGVRHVPEQAGWQQLMDDLHSRLEPAAPTSTPPAPASCAGAPPAEEGETCAPLLKVKPETAREEYLLNGQEGLDELLAALDGGFEVRLGVKREGFSCRCRQRRCCRCCHAGCRGSSAAPRGPIRLPTLLHSLRRPRYAGHGGAHDRGQQRRAADQGGAGAPHRRVAGGAAGPAGLAGRPAGPRKHACMGAGRGARATLHKLSG